MDMQCILIPLFLASAIQSSNPYSSFPAVQFIGSGRGAFIIGVLSPKALVPTASAFCNSVRFSEFVPSLLIAVEKEVISLR